MVTERGLRLMVFDRTCAGPRTWLPGLSAAWRAGGNLYRALGRFDRWTGASTWAEALDWLAAVEPGRAIEEVQYWGHGTWGRVWLARECIDADALAPTSALRPRLERVRERLLASPDEARRLWWFRTCETVGREAGHDFARRWSDFFASRVAGHTYVIHALQSGLHSLRPGEAPRWSVDEGLPAGVAQPRSALNSGLREVNTITCLRGDVPAGY